MLPDTSSVNAPVLLIFVPPTVMLPPVLTAPTVAKFAPVNVNAVVEPDLTSRLFVFPCVNAPYCVPLSFRITSHH